MNKARSNARRLALVLGTSLALWTALVPAAALAEEPDAAAADTGVRFTRADLVDVATFVADRSGTGFVIGDPTLRTLTLSLYLPQGGSPAQVSEMFMAALDAAGVEAVMRDGYWLIQRKGAGSGSAAGADVTLDFRGAGVEDVIAFLSQVSGRQFIVLSDVPRRPLTIQAQQALSADAAVELVLTALEAEGVVVERPGAGGGAIILRGPATSAVTPRDSRENDATPDAMPGAARVAARLWRIAP